jgi:S1-C subfamily serine protease
MESGVVNRPVLGVTVSEVKGYEGYEDGVYIVEVSNGSAAEKAGVKVEDRVVEFNNTKITTVDELLSEVQKAQPNEKVEMIVARNGKEITLDVELGSENPFSNQESKRNKLE